MSAEKDRRNEWIVLARNRFDMFLNEARRGLDGRTNIPDMQQAAEGVQDAMSMVIQYSKSNAENQALTH